MKKNSLGGCSFAGLFLRTHLLSFCPIEREAPWQLATDSYFTAAESTGSEWVSFPLVGETQTIPFLDELKSHCYLLSYILDPLSQKYHLWVTVGMQLCVFHYNEEQYPRGNHRTGF